MSTITAFSNVSAPTQFLHVKNDAYAYRRFGSGPGRPLLCLQHFMGTLENWDPAVTDPLAAAREVILFNNAGVGRSAGKVPTTVAGMATHALNFLDGLGVASCDVLGFSLGGMVAQQMARDRPLRVRRMILVGTAPRGGEDIMRLGKPTLARHLADPTLKGYAVLQKIFFAPTASSQAAGRRFIERLAQRKEDVDPASGPDVAAAQTAAFRVGAICGDSLRRSQGHPSAHARRQWLPRRNDSRFQLVPVGRKPSERRTSRIPGLRTRLSLPISRLVYPPRGGISRIGCTVRTLLSRREVTASAWKLTTPIRPLLRA
jgi:pimeloyl-ACP methyl ester carboxylesterase